MLLKARKGEASSWRYSGPDPPGFDAVPPAAPAVFLPVTAFPASPAPFADSLVELRLLANYYLGSITDLPDFLES